MGIRGTRLCKQRVRGESPARGTLYRSDQGHRKGRESALTTWGSDAFFPFADGIKAADCLGLAMLFHTVMQEVTYIIVNVPVELVSSTDGGALNAPGV